MIPTQQSQGQSSWRPIYSASPLSPAHNSFDNAERLDAKLAITLVTALYIYFARLPRMASGDVVAES